MEHLIPYIATGITSFAVGVLLMYLRPKAKLVFWSPHNFRYRLGAAQNNLEIQTDAWTIQNIGRAKTENVDFVFGEQPDHYQLQPSISHDTETLQNGNFLIRIPELAPKEVVTVQILSYTKLPQPLTIRSDAGLAQTIPIQFQRILPKWLAALLLLLMLIGLGTTMYWMIEIGYTLYSCTECAA